MSKKPGKVQFLCGFRANEVESQVFPLLRLYNIKMQHWPFFYYFRKDKRINYTYLVKN